MEHHLLTHLCVSLVLVPDEAELGVGGHGVVGSDVAVEQGTFDPDRLAGQDVVLLQVHGPVDATVHCRQRGRRQRRRDGQKTSEPMKKSLSCR